MNLPPMAKILLNIFLYLFYVVVASLAFSLLFPIVLQLFGREILDPTNPVFVKIQIFIAVLVLLITLILRRYFYITAKEHSIQVKETYTVKKTQDKIEKKVELNMDFPEEDEIKIYVEKEIK